MKKNKRKQIFFTLFNLKNKTKIKDKILVLIITAILTVILLTTIISISISYNSTMNTINSFMIQIVKIASNNVKTEIDAKLVTVSEFASRAYFLQDDKNVQEISMYCDEFSKRHDYLKTLYIDKNGITMDGNDVSDRDYFKQTKETLKPVISDPLYSKDLNIMVVVLASPIIKDGQFDGLIITQASAKFLSDLTHDIKMGESGNCYILDKRATTLAHVDESKVLESYNGLELSKTDKSLLSLAKIQEKMINGEEGASTYTFNGEQKILGYSPVGINEWSIGVAGNTFEFLKSLYLSIAIIIVIAILSIITVIYVVSKHITRIVTPLQLCSERVVLLGEGDLNSDFPIIETEDEIGVMANTTKNMITSLSEMIKDVDYILENMAKGNFNINSNAENSYKGDFSGILKSINTLNSKLSNALKNINDASVQVAFGSLQMSENAQTLAEGATQQSGTVQELMSTISNVTTIAKNSADKTNSAYTKAKIFEQQAQESSKEMEQLIKAMDDINETSSKIENIISEIEDVASQTKMLSLNASIEAARAGEAGRGFAVVADNIGKLATDSAMSAINTRELIGKSIQEIKNGNDITLRTSQTLAKVIDGIKLLAQLSKETSDLSNSQADIMNQIEQNISQISAVVESNSASAEETSATSEELSAQSENLKDLVAQFQLKIEK